MFPWLHLQDVQILQLLHQTTLFEMIASCNHAEIAPDQVHHSTFSKYVFKINLKIIITTHRNAIQAELYDLLHAAELTRDVGRNPCCCCCDHLVVTSCQIQKAVRAYEFAELSVGVCGNFLPQN